MGNVDQCKGLRTANRLELAEGHLSFRQTGAQPADILNPCLNRVKKCNGMSLLIHSLSGIVPMGLEGSTLGGGVFNCADLGAIILLEGTVIFGTKPDDQHGSWFLRTRRVSSSLHLVEGRGVQLREGVAGCSAYRSAFSSRRPGNPAPD